MEDEYMIFESKMNYTSLTQLESEEPLTIPTIIKKLTDLANEPNKANVRALNMVGGILSGNIQENVSTVFKLPRGVFYNSKRRTYSAQKEINKKKYHIKESGDVIEVIKALHDFCLEKNISL